MQRNPDHHRPQLETLELITTDGFLSCVAVLAFAAVSLALRDCVA
jgi:hypothetical protein